MSFDSNTLATAIEAATEVILGHRMNGSNVIERATTVEGVTAIKGTTYYVGTAESLPRDLGSHMPGSDAKIVDSALSSTSYSCEVYDYLHRFTEEEEVDFAGLMGATVIDTFMPILMDTAECAAVADLKVLLDAETSAQAAQNGAWDVETSTIHEDIALGLRTYCPRADVCIVGANTADDMKLHSDFKAGVDNYASRAMIGEDAALEAVLKAKFGFKEVVVARDLYNSANAGQTASAGYIFGDFFWAGRKNALLTRYQKGTDRMPRFTRNVRAGNALEMYYKRVLDFIRPDTANGVRWTSIGT